MMYPYPFFGFPYYRKHYSNLHNQSNADSNSINNCKKNTQDSPSENECFDDLLIIMLLIFLYKEGSDDIYLFIALLLLLFS